MDDKVQSDNVDQDYKEDADDEVYGDNESINDEVMPHDKIDESNGSPEKKVLKNISQMKGLT